MARRRRTAATIAASLKERWQTPTSAQLQALGSALWQDLLHQRTGALLTQEGLDGLLPLLLTEQAARAVWTHLPRDPVLAEARAIQASALTVRDFLGPEAIEHLKNTMMSGNHAPDRALVEKLIDQPYFRLALKNLVQRSIQQFIQQFRPGAGARKGPGTGILGSVGRGIAHRAGRAAKAGKNIVEGIGAGIYRQLEDQLQPFLAGFMSRSAQTFTEVMFEGEEQARLAQEARLHVLEVILDAPISSLMPPLTENRLEQQLTMAQHVAAHMVRTDVHRERIERIVRAIYDQWKDKTVQDMLEAFALPETPPAIVLESLGNTALTLLTGDAVQAFLEQEISAVW